MSSPPALRPNALPAAITAVLLAAGVAVRAIPAANEARRPADGSVAPIDEPMQLLWAGAELRLNELDALVDEERRGTWVLARRAVADTGDCPETTEWLGTADGQAVARIAAQLMDGSPEGAFCALVLHVQVARRTAWDPGVFGGSQDAERLGGLFLAWLRRWAEPSVEDPLLREPALSAFLLYGLVMERAASGNAFSSSEASRERARGALRELLGEPGRDLSAFGAAVVNRYPRAFAALTSGSGLADVAHEAELWFPDLDGECGG